jgi:polyisoprenoid-binding protein YceI
MRVPLFEILMLAMMASCVMFAETNLAAAIAPVQLSTDGESEEKDTVVTGVYNWELDNEHSSVVCAVSHFGLSYIYGRFNTCSGSIEMDFQNPDSAKFRFEIDADSIDSNNASRDVDLRGPNCLDARQFSTITFESINVTAKDTQRPDGKTKRTFMIDGNLSIAGETRKTKIPLELLAMGNGADGKLRCGFMSKFVVRRSDFGLDAMADSIGDSVAVTFCFQAVRKNEEKESEDDSVEAIDFGSDKESKSEFGADKDAEDKRKSLEELFRKTPSNDNDEAEIESESESDSEPDLRLIDQ